MTDIDHDTLKMTRDFAGSLRRRVDLMREVKPDTGDARRAVTRVTHPPNLGRTMSAVGLALIICPDPFSDVIGVPLMVTGELISRCASPAKLSDVTPEFERVYREIDDVVSNL